MMMLRKKSTRELVQGEPDDTPEQEPVEKKKKPREKRAKTPHEPHSRAGAAFFKTKLFYGIICIAVGLAIALLGAPILRSQTTNTVNVVCFVSDVSSGSVVTASDVVVVEVSSYHLPTGTVFDTGDVVGKYLRTDALAGDYVTAQRLSDVYPGDDPFLIDLPEGKMAISVSLPDLSQSVSGKLRAGDVVQIFALETGSDSTVADAPSELQYVEVLAATYLDGVDVSDGKTGANVETDSDTLSTATLLVNERQAAKIAGLETQAKLYAALVIRGNESRKAEALAAQDDYFTKLDEAEAALQAQVAEDAQATEPAPDEAGEGQQAEGAITEHETAEGGA